MKTLTCVIVDDEIGSTDVLSHHVSQISYLTLEKVFQNPIEALAYLLKNPTDLLITDIVMPELSGIELYEHLITEVHTQVIFVSGYADQLVESLKYSVVDYLQKPVGFKRFEEATSKALKLAQVNEKIYQVIPREVLDEVLKNYAKLSIAEKRILDLIATDKTSKTIADELFISTKTVESHRFKIRKKLSLFIENNLTIVAKFLKERIK